MFNTLGRKRASKEDVQRAATLGRYDNAPQYGGGGGKQPPRSREYEDDPRKRETAFPPKDVYFDKVR